MAIDKNAIEREIKKKTTGYLNEELNSFDASVDAANARITESGEKSIETTNKSYEDVFRKNRLNQIINEEKTKERMANLGLTDSGLNRTQQTAIQLQAANADAAAVRNRQAAIDTIRSGIANAIAENDAKKADYKRERTSYWNEKADTMIANEYNTQVAEENARIEAELKAAEARQKAWGELASAYANKESTGTQLKVLVDNFAKQYGISDEEKQALVAYNNEALSEDAVLPVIDRTFVKTKDTANYTGNLFNLFGLFGGGDQTIDWNDKVKDQYGNEFTLQELKNNFGFTDEQLTELTKLRQKDVGKRVTKSS